jgi:hypothetical protein
MLLKMKDPRSIFRMAAACLVLFFVLGLPRAASSFSEGMLDGMRGTFLGAALMLFYFMFRLKRKQERNMQGRR